MLVLRSWDEDYPQDSSVHLVTDEETLKSAEGKKLIRKYLEDIFERDNRDDEDVAELDECIQGLLTDYEGYFGVKYYWDEQPLICSKKPSKTFRNKKDYRKALDAVYCFHEQVHETVLALLRRKGDIELKRGIKFSFLEMEGTYTVHAVRLTDNRKDFYLETTSESGDTYHIDWPQINHDMIVTEWLMGLKWPDTYPEYEY